MKLQHLEISKYSHILKKPMASRSKCLLILLIVTLAAGCAQTSAEHQIENRINRTNLSKTQKVNPISPNRRTFQRIPRNIRQTSNLASGIPDCRADRRAAPFVLSSEGLGEKARPGPYSLRTIASQRSLLIGAGVGTGLAIDPIYGKLLGEEFNITTPENAMKWEFIHPEENRYNFTEGDVFVNKAIQQDMLVRGHVLVWDLQLPPWVSVSDRSRAEWIQILCRHIKTVVSHYRGRIYAWDVVNEAINADGTLRNTFWMRAIGPEYIPMAFQWAREADPNALLFYNDNGGEGLNTQSQAIYTLVRSLLDAGIPIDGVGMQMHTAIGYAPTTEEIQANMQRLSEAGLDIQITEMDVKLQYSDKSEAVELAAQAEIYQRVLNACLSVESCSAFLTWGLTDKYSWIPGWTGKPDAPLLFDEESKPKPAYWAILETLSKAK